MIQGVLTATLLIGCVGLLIGLFLGLAGIGFFVETDKREEEVLNALPGNNCGGCGFAGCAGLAAAIVKGEAPVNACPVGGATVAENVASIMGVEAGNSEKMVAYVMCNGDCDKAHVDYEYIGEGNCGMLSFVPNGGPKSCNHGCLGFGECVKACMFGAIQLVNGVAVVNKELCTACGKCVAACPKNIIELLPYKSEVHVTCSSTEKGPIAKKACEVACIGCGICQKNCPSEAISVNNFLAKIDYSKCTNCGICREKCPTKAIN